MKISLNVSRLDSAEYFKSRLSSKFNSMISILKTQLPQIGVLIFLLITFGISILEKITDWKGTINYIQHNFKDTFIKGLITPLILGLLCLEIVTCMFLIIGLYQLVTQGSIDMALLGFALSGLSILYMLIGQRIAKDYVGATSLTVYFILTVLGMYFLV